MCVCVRARARARVRACVRVCMRVRVRVCVYVLLSLASYRGEGQLKCYNTTLLNRSNSPFLPQYSAIVASIHLVSSPLVSSHLSFGLRQSHLIHRRQTHDNSQQRKTVAAV